MNEYLYLLSNPSIPDLIKIGMTANTPDERMEQLFSTGVPEKFILEYSVRVPNGATAERLAHNALNTYRHRSNREFFRISVTEAVTIINSNIGSYIPHTDRLDTIRKAVLKKAREEEEAEFEKEMQLAKTKAENIVRLESLKIQLRKKFPSLKAELVYINKQLEVAKKKLTDFQLEYRRLGVKPIQEERTKWSFFANQTKLDNTYKALVKPWQELESAIKNSEEIIHQLEEKLSKDEQEISKFMLILNGK